MSKDLVDELREVKQEIREVHEALTEINTRIKTHPLKAAAGPGANHRAVRTWEAARAVLLEERQALVDRMFDLEADKTEIIKELGGTRPITDVYLTSVIEQAIDIEMLLPDQPERAHERLTHLIDWLESVEGTG